MQYHLHQSVSFHGKIYPRGVHELPAEVEKHPYFHQMVKAGLVSEVDAAKEVKQESAHERSERLYQKLTGKKPPKVEKEEGPGMEAKSPEQKAPDKKKKG